MKIKETLAFAILFILASNSLYAYGELPLGVAHYYTTTGNKVCPYRLPNDSTQRFMAMGENCRVIEEFRDQFLAWSKRISSNDTATPVTPRCECEGNVCGIELTDLFPEPFKGRMNRSGRYFGPNCYNTALINAGFLDLDQSRQSRPEEFQYFIGRYCREVPIHERRPNDIIAFFKQNESGKELFHAAFYIGYDIIFEKGGASLDAPYQLQDLRGYPTDVLSTQVFRCNNTSDKNSKNKKIWALEKELSELVDSTSPAKTIGSRLKVLDTKLTEVVATEYRPDSPPQSPNSHAINGLDLSFARMKQPIEKEYRVELEERVSWILVPASKIKRPVSFWTENVSSDLSVGDRVQILEGAWARERGFKADRFYKILEMPSPDEILEEFLTYKEKEYIIERIPGQRVLVRASDIQSFKIERPPGSVRTENVPSDLSVGDHVQILENEWTRERGLKVGNSYKVVGIFPR